MPETTKIKKKKHQKNLKRTKKEPGSMPKDALNA